MSHKEENLVVLEEIEERIYLLRGQKVMLDSDLADIYKVETRVLNQAVTRNLNRFLDDFVFQINKEETEKLRDSSQFVMSPHKLRGSSYRPRVLPNTEQ